ncbi:MAG: DNA-binding response regulator, partial [Betaproteobacteria bacterium]|nr:DNA-binding response regulator [Betaproteobacteria bacterium]
NLQQAGFGVLAVADGQAALDSPLERASDLLVLDLAICPGWTGWRWSRRCAHAAAPRPS